ncbi:MAG: zinc-ribbon domain-containing protein, partial [Actinobacteria bacterium]|nr:zinc-ribbon domain-containing protein [Actinomycetota bacterium]
MASGFCGKCGAPISDLADAFCRKCGAALAVGAKGSPPQSDGSTPPSRPGEPPPGVPIASQAGSGSRTGPLLLALVGLGLLFYFGTQAVAQNAVITRINQSTAVKAANGLDVLGRLIPGAGTVGTVVDPRNSQQYIDAVSSAGTSTVMAVFGLI